MIGTLGERLPDLDRIDLFNALVAQRRNEYQNRDKGSTIEVELDPESGPNEERPEDSGNEESETEIDSTEEITVAELHYLGVDPKLESHKRLGSEFRKQAFAFQKHIPPDSDLRKLHPVFSLGKWNRDSSSADWQQSQPSGVEIFFSAKIKREWG